MKAHFVAFAATLAVLASGSAHAKKKVSAPAPNIAASAKVDISIAQETLPGSATFADVTIKYTVSHSFSLTAQQEAALSGDTVISILSMEVSPNEDPKFDNGDKSFTVTKNLPLGIVDVPAQFKGKWGNGQFSGSIKLSYKGKDLLLSETLQKIHQTITGTKELAIVPQTVGPKAENLAYIETAISAPSIDAFSVEAIMASDVEMTMTEGFTAKGVEYQSQSQKIQTKFFAPAVISAK